MGKHVAKLGAMCVTGALAVAPTAGAYNIPGINPGNPGGPNTSPSGGNHASRASVNRVAGRMTGLTGAELALKADITVTLHYPKGGRFKCSITGTSTPPAGYGVPQTTNIGSGKSRHKHHGARNITIVFGLGGISFLNASSAVGVSITTSCTWHPQHGHSSTSTTMFETAH